MYLFSPLLFFDKGMVDIMKLWKPTLSELTEKRLLGPQPIVEPQTATFSTSTKIYYLTEKQTF